MSSICLKDKKIAIVGLGYVGLPLAVEFGKVRPVIGFDINKRRIDELVHGCDRTLEVDKKELDEAIYLELSASERSLESASIYIVTVPTPIDNANQPDFNFLISASEMVGRFLKNGDVVIYESTVFPGATEEICVPVLQHISGLTPIFEDINSRSSQGFYVGYSPERINPGDKEHRLRNIVKITSGSTPLISDAIDRLYGEIVDVGTHQAPNIKVAEAAKVIENTQRDLNIAFVNELLMIFSRLDIDTDDVLEAARTKWNFLPFVPGLVGGHCIGVDPYYLTYKANLIGHHPRVISAGRRVNDEMPAFMAQQIIKTLIKHKKYKSNIRIGILGITFKPNCPDIRNTKVIDLLEELRDWGCECVVNDPLACATEVHDSLGLRLVSIDDIRRCECIVLAVAHSEYNDLYAQIASDPKKVESIFINVSGVKPSHNKE